MPVKRRTSKHRPRLRPELRPKARRYLELTNAHLAAIRDEPGAEAFYSDGRHEESCELGSELCRALVIRPWEDDRAIIEAALIEVEE